MLKRLFRSNDIPTKIIKDNADFFSDILHHTVNTSINNDFFPDIMKIADIKPAFKNGSKTDKSNYRPVSILSNISKIYENCLYEQLSNFFEDIFSKYQCGFRKGISAQNCLTVLIEKWKRSLDSKESFGVLLTDLSKAFDVIPHDLLIAKLHAYGLGRNSLKLLHSYLSNRKQRVKIENFFSTWFEILTGVPQGSILGPLLFNIFICDLFYALHDKQVANYADDTSPFTGNFDIDSVIDELKDSGDLIFDWCNCNGMKANPEKSHVLLSETQDIQVPLQDSLIKSSKSEKLLGIIIDKDLNFEEHITNLCKKASQKLNAISRLTPYMSPFNRKLLVNAFFYSQFGYCPLVWMCHTRRLNNKINILHERCLRLIYNDYQSTFQELLDKDNSVSIHYRNIRTLATEIYKFVNGISAPIMDEIFSLNDTSTFNLRSQNPLKRIIPKTVWYGTESLSYLAPKIWDIVPDDIKDSNSLPTFKSKIKQWIPSSCPCRLCKTYLPQIGFI